MKKNIVITNENYMPKTNKRWESFFGDMGTYDLTEIHLAYGWFFKEGQKQGLNVYLSYHDQYDYKKGVFKKLWELKNNEWQIIHGIKPNYVFNKAGRTTPANDRGKKFFNRKKIMFNNLHIENICKDKLLTYKTFPKLVPKCFLVNNRTELNKALKKIETERVVLKPFDGASARGIIIDHRDKLPKKIPKGTLVQEFIDTTKGIPNIVKGVADLRLVIVNGKINHSFVRIAKKGSFISNISMGGSEIMVDNKNVPKNLLNIVKEVNKKLVKYHPYVFTLDFAFDPTGKPYLIEMNSQPAFFSTIREEDKGNKKMIKGIISTIKKYI